MKALSWIFNIKIFPWGKWGTQDKGGERRNTMTSLAPRTHQQGTPLAKPHPFAWRRAGLVTSSTRGPVRAVTLKPSPSTSWGLRREVGAETCPASSCHVLEMERGSQGFWETRSVWGAERDPGDQGERHRGQVWGHSEDQQGSVQRASL